MLRAGRRTPRIIAAAAAIALSYRGAGPEAPQAGHSVPLQRLAAAVAAAPPLLPRAHRVCRVPGEFGKYMWLSDTRLMVCPEGFTQDPVIEIDAANGRVRELTAFTRALYRLMPHGGAAFTALSPDRRWVLLQEGMPGAPCLRWDAISVDGRRTARGQLGEMVWPAGQGLWMRDSAHWAAVGLYDAGLLVEVYSIRRPSRREAVVVPAPPRYEASHGTYCLADGGGPDAGTVAAVFTRCDSAPPEARILEMPLSAGNRVREEADPADALTGPHSTRPATADRRQAPRERRVQLAPGTCQASPAFSPDFHRIAWMLCVHGPPDRAGRYDTTLQLWVSDNRGKHMREVGRDPVEGPYCGSTVYDLAWLPDSRHVSFTFNGWIYVVRVAR